MESSCFSLFFGRVAGQTRTLWILVGIAVTNPLPCTKCSGEIVSGSLRIGAVSAPVYNAQEKMKVPDVLFYDNVQVRTLLCGLGLITS